MKKYEFMYRMDKALGALSESEKSDIINDYEEHFRIGAENGKTDDEICASLGNPEELAKSYLEGTEQQTVETDNSGVSDGGVLPQQNTGYQTAQQSTKSNTLGIVTLIILLIFVFIPIGSTILGLLVGFFFGTLGCVVGGIAVICISWFMIGSVAGVFAMITLGIALISLGVLLGYATYYGCKGTYKLVLMLIDFCKNLIK